MVILKETFIITGRGPLYFHWSFFVDLAVMRPYPLLPLYLLILLLNSLIAHYRPIPVAGRFVKPVELLMIAWAEEWDFYLNPAAECRPYSRGR